MVCYRAIAGLLLAQGDYRGAAEACEAAAKEVKEGKAFPVEPSAKDICYSELAAAHLTYGAYLGRLSRSRSWHDRIRAAASSSYPPSTPKWRQGIWTHGSAREGDRSGEGRELKAGRANVLTPETLTDHYIRLADIHKGAGHYQEAIEAMTLAGRQAAKSQDINYKFRPYWGILRTSRVRSQSA